MDDDPTDRRPEVEMLADLVDRVLYISREIRSRGYTDADVVVLNESEGNIMRFIDRHPNSLPSEVAQASGYQRSNLSSTLKSLEEKGLVHREADPHDSRLVRLRPTSLAEENLVRMRRSWGRLLEDAVGQELDDLAPALAFLDRLEHGLFEGRRR